MKIGCPKEIKPQEFRVGMTPNAAGEAVTRGHEVIIETGAGMGSGFDNDAYIAAGARIVDTAEEVFATADMIVKVKEPQAGERKMLREGQLAVHLPAPGTRSRPDPRSACVGLHRDCLRNRHRRKRRPAAAGTDVRSCRSTGTAGRIVDPAKGQWRPRRPDGRRPWCWSC